MSANAISLAALLFILGLVLLAVVMFQPKGLLGFLVSDRERIGSYGRRRRGG